MKWARAVNTQHQLRFPISTKHKCWQYCVSRSNECIQLVFLFEFWGGRCWGEIGTVKTADISLLHNSHTHISERLKGISIQQYTMKQTITPKREQKRTVTHHGEHTRTRRLNVYVCNMRHIVEYQHVDSRHIWIGWAHFAYLKTSWNASDQNVWASLSHFHVNRREIPFLSNVRIINGFGWINFRRSNITFWTLYTIHHLIESNVKQAGRQAIKIFWHYCFGNVVLLTVLGAIKWISLWCV